MKLLFGIVLLLSIRPSVFPQRLPIDSLENILRSAPSDTARVIALADLASKYLANDPLKAKQYSEEGLRLAMQAGFLRGQAITLNHLGDYQFRQSNYAKAFECATQALKIAIQIPDSIIIADSYRLLGNIHTFGLKQYDEALQYQLKALKIYEKRKYKNKIAALYGSITWVYAVTNQNLEQAMHFATKGAAIASSIRDYQLVSYNFNSKGMIFFKQKKLDSALYYLKLSSNTAKRAQDNAVIAFNNSIIGNVLLEQGEFISAEKVFIGALEESKSINLREVEKEAYEGLAKCYHALGKHEKAYHYQVLFMQLRDSLLNWETTQKTLTLRAGYEQERREAKIADLTNENLSMRKEERLYLFISVGLFFTFLVITLLIGRNNKQRKEASLLLKEKSEEIKSQNDELLKSREEISAQRDLVAEQNTVLQKVNETKDRLFSIIGHDLRGPIASLKGLLGLVAKDAVSPEEFRVLAPKLNQNVISIHDTMENLLQWSYTQMKGLKSSPSLLKVTNFVAENIMLFAETAKAKQITLVNCVSDAEMVYADANHVSLILRNLINNAVKFTPIGGKIIISAKQIGNQVEISIEDTGMGIPPTQLATLFQSNVVTTLGTHGEKGTGLGLILCKEMAEINGGEIKVTSELSRGSTFTLRLKSAG